MEQPEMRRAPVAGGSSKAEVYCLLEVEVQADAHTVLVGVDAERVGLLAVLQGARAGHASGVLVAVLTVTHALHRDAPAVLSGEGQLGSAEPLDAAEDAKAETEGAALLLFGRARGHAGVVDR